MFSLGLGLARVGTHVCIYTHGTAPPATSVHVYTHWMMMTFLWVDAGSEDYEFTLDALVTFYFLVLGLMVWTYGASASTRTLDWSAFVCLSLCAHVCFSSVLT